MLFFCQCSRDNSWCIMVTPPCNMAPNFSLLSFNCNPIIQLDSNSDPSLHHRNLTGFLLQNFFFFPPGATFRHSHSRQRAAMLSDVAYTTLFSIENGSSIGQNNSQNAWNVAISPVWVAWLKGFAASNLLLAVWRAGEGLWHPFIPNDTAEREGRTSTSCQSSWSVHGIKGLQGKNEQLFVLRYICEKEDKRTVLGTMFNFRCWWK